ncbi:MAG: polysaccharide biosynthesis tyrosine autokinase [Gammaproteobacteria bacterium]|nr:polysaccharide biosynthesis tyrosine autokinase [Gammaproteobacteria bacterium]
MNTIEKALQRKKDLEQSQAKKVSQAYHDTTTVDNELNINPATVSSFKDQQNFESKITKASRESFEQGINSNFSSHGDKIKKQSKIIEINMDYLEKLGFLVPNNRHTIINDEFRQIKRPLIRNIQGRTAHPIERANVLQVTSSLQGEGKTFTAINLALSFAMEMDFNVLLVDADTIKSSITRTLINSTEKGLTDYLTGDVEDLSDLMLKTNIPKLSILPAGQAHLLSAELLNSQYMENLIVEFSQRYENRIVIFDSPPLLQTNDSRILSQKVGQLVFVVEQHKTEQSIVKSAVSLIDPDLVVGVVMNKTRNSGHTGYYGYYAPNEEGN